MEEQLDSLHSGQLVGPAPEDFFVFPDRCVRCGKPAPFEARLKKHTGLGFPLGIMVSCCLPFLFLLPLAREIELRVPVCRWCREWHQLAYVAALLGTLLAVLVVGVAGIFLGVWLAMELALAWWGVLICVLVALAVIFLIIWFGGTRLIDITNLRVLGVAIHRHDKTGNEVILSFRDPALAEDVAARSFVIVDSPT